MPPAGDRGRRHTPHGRSAAERLRGQEVGDRLARQWIAEHGDAYVRGKLGLLLEGPLDWAWHLSLPWVTLALVTAAIYVWLTRGRLLQVSEDYIRTARAKGLSERKVVYRHVMRATLTPLVTQLGAEIAILLGGAIVIEQVYGLQGVGALAVQAVQNQDRPIIIGVVMLGGFFIVVTNLIVDLLYAALDPRIR